IRSEELQAPAAKLLGTILLVLGACAAGSLFGTWRLFSGAIPIGGIAGIGLAAYLLENLNLAGAIVATGTALIIAVYLVSPFRGAILAEWFAGPMAWLRRRINAWHAWRDEQRDRAFERAREKARIKAEKLVQKTAVKEAKTAGRRARTKPPTMLIE